jgi:hypothetical protein
MIERQAESVRKELAKLTARLERQIKKYAKETANVEKMGANCTEREWFDGMREKYTNEQAWAWIEWTGAKRDIEETKSSIANAEKRLAKLTGKVEEHAAADAAEAAETEKIGKIEIRFLSAEEREANAAQRLEEYEKWLAEFKAACLEDGIVIDEAHSTWFDGTDANGRRFFININNGIRTEVVIAIPFTSTAKRFLQAANS